MLNEWLLRILVCPKTHAPLVVDGDWLVSTDAESRLRYPIRDGIPHMIEEEAEVLSEEEWLQVMERAGSGNSTEA